MFEESEIGSLARSWQDESVTGAELVKGANESNETELHIFADSFGHS